jgi:cobalt/nickel transport system permease protein
MIQEPFAIGSSFLHRLDPRVRVTAATAYSFVVALAMQFWVLNAALVISLALVLLSRVSLKEVGKRLLVVNGFIFMLWLLLPATFGGEVLYRLGPVPISRPGIILAARITLKSNAILLCFIALIATMPLATLGHALGRLGVPSKIVLLLLMTYRYIFVFEQEYLRLWRAVKIRAFRPKTNLHTYRTYAYIIGMLFVRAAARAERVHQAMLCRGFRGKFHSLQEFQTTSAAYIFAAVMTAVLLAMIVFECNS